MVEIPWEVGEIVVIGPNMGQSMENVRGRKATVKFVEHPRGGALKDYVWITIDGVAHGPQHGDCWTAAKKDLIRLYEIGNNRALTKLVLKK